MRQLDWLDKSDSVALSNGLQALSYRQLRQAITLRTDWLLEQQPQVVALELGNGIEWVLFDLACAEAAIPCVPVPAFFNGRQRWHMYASAGIDLLIGDQSHQGVESSPFSGVTYTRLPMPSQPLPRDTRKITFTSGSTGTPKGVCLSLEQQLTTARALLQATGIQQPVHLAILPLATLLENIAGIYAPLLAGGTVYVPDSQTVGFSGSRLTCPEKLLRAITDFKPDSMILVPELLSLLVMAVNQGWRPPPSLQFLAVGGAKVSSRLLKQAVMAGLPVYQGYGLSECGSVVALNTPRDNAQGSIGKPLSHVNTLIRDSELIVRGQCFLGYLHDRDSWYPAEVTTGDLVSQDQQGFLWFEGRERNLIVSSFGRNINPEWPESELLAENDILQAVVLGNDRPHCSAVIATNGPVNKTDLSACLRRINQRLPDYAQIRQCLLLPQAITPDSGMYTENGRPNRPLIERNFADEIASLYSSDDDIRIINAMPDCLLDSHDQLSSVSPELILAGVST